MKITNHWMGVLGAVMLSAQAHAAGTTLECTDFDYPKDRKLKIQELGNGAVQAILTVHGRPTLLQGTELAAGGAFTFSSVEKYALQTRGGTPVGLSVTYQEVMSRGGCGRGSCDRLPNYRITAKLEYPSLTLEFACHAVAL